jgi:predicted PurR-regulated permease PerM
MRWIALALVIVTAFLIAPFAPWVILAIWIASLVRPVQRRLASWFRGRTKLAAAVTTVLLLALAIPVVLLLANLAMDAYKLVAQLASSGRVKELLEQLVSHPEDHLGKLAGESGRVWAILQKIAGSATRVVIGLFVFTAGVYAVLVNGRRWYAWMEDHAPIPRDAVSRLADAFQETGRGLFVGVLGSGLVQAVMATVGYFVLEIPDALALGLLTLIMSIVPAFGTALVWGPVAIGLALTGRTFAALGLVVYGAAVIGTIDNLVRPYFARRGKLQLPAYVLLFATFGGVATIGAWGLLLAPLAVRLSKEALEILHDSPSITSR